VHHPSIMVFVGTMVQSTVLQVADPQMLCPMLK
jgi:hypothetical protein